MSIDIQQLSYDTVVALIRLEAEGRRFARHDWKTPRHASIFVIHVSTSDSSLDIQAPAELDKVLSSIT